jgi:hypothetical protein
VPEALIAYSCDKNFGYYRDRVARSMCWPRMPIGAILLERRHAGPRLGRCRLITAARWFA